jgi:class 3 adenylate cyclase
MTTGVACASCGTGLRESAKFCDECGTPTAVSGDTAAKYKQVTVLFADVVRSMDIAAAVDPERLRDIMTDLVERSATVVRRYGGTVEYNGDGVMALFGAPVALEDHAFRACLAALDIQAEANRLATEVQRNDGVTLRLRVGLNSGRVIAGEIGSGSLGYRATGAHVGFAQRIESVAPPGGAMLSESTASLVEHTMMLGEPEWVRIKGADEPVRARRLVGIGPPRDGMVGRSEASLIGRRREMTTLETLVDNAIGGRGGVVNLVGPAGIGKSRVAREVAALAAGRGVEVLWSFCESHASGIPFRAVSGLLRASIGVADLDSEAARARVREQVPDADPQDLLLLHDLLGIADPEVRLPQIDPDARRRRLAVLINAASLARTEPAMFIIEDAHWIDDVSESMLAELFKVILRTSSMVLITSRPEYEGTLTRVHGAQTIALAPLGDSDSTTLLSELLGHDHSVGELAAIIAERAAGNPFFAEEMVRELVQRGVLTGERGDYLCGADVAELSVPATVQAAIEARIDRQTTAARRTLYAASVIGARFEAELLATLGVDAAFDELLSAELIDQVRFTPSAEYAFRHPLIRAVAYESQLKSDRAQWHLRLAAAIQERAPGSVEENAALIAEHLESAGDLHAAYGWHMRAGTWSIHRDITAARVSWERARRIADALPDADPARTKMRIAPSTMLCASAWRATQDNGAGLFEELQGLCAVAGDKASMAIAMTGLITKSLLRGRTREASRLASDQMALLESIGDPGLTVAAAYVAIAVKGDTGEMPDVLRWSQTVVDLAEGDPVKGANFGMGSPLAAALVWRGIARYWLGHGGWRQDLDDAVVMARSSDPATHALIVAYKYHSAVQNGVLRADETAVREIEEALQVAEGLSGDTALGLIKGTLSGALLSRDAPADRQRGLEILTQVRDMWQRERSRLYLIPIGDVFAARERARSGDRDGAIPVMRDAVNQMHQAGRFGYGVPLNGVLIETLLDRGEDGDLAEAQAVIDRMANLPADEDLVVRDIWLLRLRALLSRARGDRVAHRDLAIRYHAMAESLGFEGHLAWAEAMIQEKR